MSHGELEELRDELRSWQRGILAAVADNRQAIDQGLNSKHPLRFDKTLNLGTMIHLAVLFAVIVGGAITVKLQVTAVQTEIESIVRQTTRIERYLSSKDQNYWKQSRENGDQ